MAEFTKYRIDRPNTGLSKELGSPNEGERRPARQQHQSLTRQENIRKNIAAETPKLSAIESGTVTATNNCSLSLKTDDFQAQYSPSVFLSLFNSLLSPMGKGKKKDKKLKLVEDSKTKHQVFLSWSCPRKGWYKLNVDGTAHKRIGGGGVIRDEHGQWVGGFSANFGKGKAIDAELSALLTGLEYAWSSGWYPLEVETDAIRAIMFLVNEVEVDYNHPQFDLVKRCQAVLKHNWTYNLRHVYREQNCVADSLAKHGRTLEPGCHYFTDPPPHCIPLLAEDHSGVARPRFITPKAMQYRTMTSQSPITGESKKIEVSLEKEDLASVTFRWKIDNFSELTLKHYSEVFIIGDFKWRVLIYPKGNNTNHLSVYLEVPDSSDLPNGWSRYAQFSLTMVNQVNHSKSFTKGTVHVFSIHESEFGFQSLAPLILLRDQRNGFLVNDTCIIEAEVGVRKAEVKIMEDPSSSISASMEALIIGEKQNEE